MSKKQNPYFRDLVPEWLKYVAIILTLVPTMLIFSAANVGVPQEMGEYGFSSNDVNFGMMAFYGIVVAYGPMGNHFFNRLPLRTYLWLTVTFEMLSLYGAYKANNLPTLALMRVFNSIFNTGIVSIALNLLYSKLKSENAKEIGFGFFYGLVMSAGVLCSLIGAFAYDEHSVRRIYIYTIFALVPGVVLLSAITRNVHLMPFSLVRFKKLGWADFLFIAITLLSFAFMMLYGKELDYFSHPRMRVALVLFIVFFTLEIIRLRNAKHPYLDLSILKYADYRFGILLLIILYFIRGAFNLSLQFFSTILGGPFKENGYILFLNILGIIIGSIISTWRILQKKSIRITWLIGFSIMLFFYGYMSFHFDLSASIWDYVWLIIIQGAGQGFLMSPIIQYYISAVPKKNGGDAGLFGVLIRFTCFTSSLGLISYTSIKAEYKHQEIVTSELNDLNPNYREYLSQMQTKLISQGASPSQAHVLVNSHLGTQLQKELFIEYAQNYYQGICILILIAMLLIIIRSNINNTIINLRNNKPFGAGF